MTEKTMEKRLAAFEDTIQTVVARYVDHANEVNESGLTRDDFVQILRASVWELLEEKSNASRAYVCKAIWNRARRLMKNRTLLKNRSQTFDPSAWTEAMEMSDPWEALDLRLDLQKLFDRLSPEEVQILWMVAEQGGGGKGRGCGNKEASKDRGISYATLKRRIASARQAAREALPAYVQKQKEGIA